MKKFLKDLTTGKDNETHDVVRTAMAVIVGMLPAVLVWGLGMQTWAAMTDKKFDLQGTFNAVLQLLTGAGAFLMSGAASLYFKRSTEPGGTVTETEEITKGPQAPDINVNTTVIQPQI